MLAIQNAGCSKNMVWEQHHPLPQPLLTSTSVHEANLLMLDSTKAMNLLGWKPVYSIDESIHETINWYKEYVDKTSDIQNFSLEQIQKYVSKAKEMNLFWSH